MNGVGSMLLGGGLVALGVLASALADRIRGLKMAREAAPARRERAERIEKSVAVEAIDEVIAKEAKRPNRSDEQQASAQEVIGALCAAGYKKSIAAEAVWGCGKAERATIETWTAAALRRCARGGVS